MSERIVLSLFWNDKTVTNPINKAEVFLCSDIYHDYRKCKALIRKGLKTKNYCREIRYLGMKCYTYSEEDFEKFLAQQFEIKRKYISYLKQEGSILYQVYRADPTVFSLKKIEGEGGFEEFNDYIIQDQKI